MKSRFPVKDFDKLIVASTVFRDLDLKKHLVELLARDYPNTWEGWVDGEKQTSTLLVHDRGVDFDALALCRKSNIYLCIPAIMYNICVRYSQVRCIILADDK